MSTERKTMRMTLGAMALLLAMGTASAQNGTNYHVLNNGFDVAYVGLGAGGSQTDDDGIGRWIPGELINGGTVDPLSTLPTYKQVAWRDSVCIFGPGPGPTLQINFPLISLTELDSSPSLVYAPVVFTPVVDPLNVIFPLGNSAGFVPFGAPTGSSASFLLAALPSACGTGALLLPNENVVPSAGGGFATLLACATNTTLTINSTGFCWSVQFTWIPSAVQSLNWPTNGWWHYLRNSPDRNQYWAVSNDELNTWQTRTVATDAGLTAVQTFTANVEYSLLSATEDPYTNISLHPAGQNQAGPYYLQTENFITAFAAPALNLNGGIDMGGHQSLTLSGVGGVPNPASGVGNQDPVAVGGLNPNGSVMFPSFGVWTFDNEDPPGLAPGDAGTPGSKRVTWVTWNSDATLNLAPNLTQWFFVFNGQVKVPSPNPASFPPWLQPLTMSLLPVFTHEVQNCPSGCPDPGGFPSGAFGVAPIQGGSDQLPLLGTGPLTTGLEICIVVGTSCLRGEPGAVEPGGLCWNPEGWSPSGETTIYITD